MKKQEKTAMTPAQVSYTVAIGYLTIAWREVTRTENRDKKLAQQITLSSSAS